MKKYTSTCFCVIIGGRGWITAKQLPKITPPCLPPYILYEYGKEGNIRRNSKISHGTYGYQCDFKCLYSLKVRGCRKRNKTSGKRRKRIEKVCTIKG